MAKAKEIEELNCEAEALSGIRLVLRTRLGEMCELRAAALDWSDIEGVHDMRVASRRLRSVLKDFGDFLGGKKRLPKRRLKKVADALGQVRDQDVAIAALEKLQSKTDDEDVAAGIGYLVDERAALRETARAKLETIIAEKPLEKLRIKFLLRLEKAVMVADGKRGKRRRRSAQAMSFRQAGREVIAARVGELKDLSDSLRHPFDIEPLHRLRIAAKRLRYILELLAPCWGGKLTPFARELSELQTSLGELRDCDIWTAELVRRLDRNRAESADALTGVAGEQGQARRAAIWLLNYFSKERGQHFRDALTRWEEWETTNFFARMEFILDNAQQPTNDTDAATTQAVYVPQEVAIAQAASAPQAFDSEPQPDHHSTPTRGKHVE